ncbi:MAG TPA: hypothetical protein VN765_03520 [Candidatus Acidoferrum sp.]|nr:hypothetical protein [Candidatus Acidoferrum sp.]
MFKKIEIDQERELEALVRKEPASIEDGLTCLTHQRRANGKYIDVLAADGDGVLVVIELKVGEDDGMLLQALEYYDYVSDNRDRLAKEYEKLAKVVAEEDPRVILVASSFSERLKRAVRHFKPDISLKEYSYLATNSGERGLCCKEVPFESETGYSAPASLDSVFAYVNLPAVKETCDKVHTDIRKIGQEMEAVPAGNGVQVRYKCKNRLVSGLTLRRTFLYVWWRKDDDSWDEVKLTNAKSWLTKKERILRRMAKHYREFGGT